MKFIKQIGIYLVILLTVTINIYATDDAASNSDSSRRKRSRDTETVQEDNLPARPVLSQLYGISTSSRLSNATMPIFIKRQMNLFSMRQISYISFGFLEHWASWRLRLSGICDNPCDDKYDVAQLLLHPDYEKAKKQFLWPYPVKFEDIQYPFKTFLPEQHYMHSSNSHADIVFQWNEASTTKSPAYAIDENLFILSARPFFDGSTEPQSLVRSFNISGLPCDLAVNHDEVGNEDHSVYAHCFIHPQYKATKNPVFDVALVFLTPFLYIPEYYREDFFRKNNLSESDKNLFRLISTPDKKVGRVWRDKYIAPAYYHQTEDIPNISHESMVDDISTNAIIPEEQHIFHHHIILRKSLLPFIMACNQAYSGIIKTHNHLYGQLSQQREFRQYSEYTAELYKESKAIDKAILMINKGGPLGAIHTATSLPLAKIQEIKNNFEEGKIEGKIDMVNNLLGMGLSDEQIAKASELPQTKIEEIRASMKSDEQ